MGVALGFARSQINEPGVKPANCAHPIKQRGVRINTLASEFRLEILLGLLRPIGAVKIGDDAAREGLFHFERVIFSGLDRRLERLDFGGGQIGEQQVIAPHHLI